MRENPALMHRPVAVGGSPEHRGVISTCNYPARREGVHSAMASRTALRLCPDLLILPHRMALYRDVSQQLGKILGQYSDVIEPLSLDEAYLDVTGSSRYSGSATRTAEAIREHVCRELGIKVSAGVAGNKFLAKVASDWRKPDGLYVVEPCRADEFIQTLPVARIPGVGKVMQQRLAELGVTECGQLQRFSQVALSEKFGSFGLRLYALCRGQDERPVSCERIRKSLSVEHTYVQDIFSQQGCEAVLPELCLRLQTRLKHLDNSCRVSKAFVKVKFTDFTQTTLERGNIGWNVGSFQVLLREALQRHSGGVRLLGVGVRFAVTESAKQMLLFDSISL